MEAEVLENYWIKVASSEDEVEMFRVLALSLLKSTDTYLDTDKSRVRKVRGVVRSSIKEGHAFLLMYDMDIVGVYTMECIDGIRYIVHASIEHKYRSSYGSLLLIDYILNTICKGETIYMYGSPKEAKNITETRYSGANKVKETIAERVSKAVRKYNVE